MSTFLPTAVLPPGSARSHLCELVNYQGTVMSREALLDLISHRESSWNEMIDALELPSVKALEADADLADEIDEQRKVVTVPYKTWLRSKRAAKHIRSDATWLRMEEARFARDRCGKRWQHSMVEVVRDYRP